MSDMYCFTAKIEGSEQIHLVASNWGAAETEAREKYPDADEILICKTVYRIISTTPHLARYKEKSN